MLVILLHFILGFVALLSGIFTYEEKCEYGIFHIQLWLIIYGIWMLYGTLLIICCSICENNIGCFIWAISIFLAIVLHTMYYTMDDCDNEVWIILTIYNYFYLLSYIVVCFRN